MHIMHAHLTTRCSNAAWSPWFLLELRRPAALSIVKVGMLKFRLHTSTDPLYQKDFMPLRYSQLFTIVQCLCYCILHEENVLGAIFSLRKDLRSAACWEEVEEALWGVLNEYQPVYAG
ncbi:hypothetical protein Taro_031861 [Colocasia esculenta]|uniref:Uncharacterized protein n=1 Tax=Colocasia esculenta TaxID=4460 RepID=A0A843VXQ7_COLES|nr:hypothetical protein [Colocasia esculenta]